MRRAAAFALPALLLAGCAAASQAPAQTDALTIENRYPLEYAKQFTVDVCAGGYDLITIDGSRYLVVPEGAAAPANLDADITVLQQPIQNIYLVSSSAMDPIISIGGLGAVALSGTQAENWYLDAARTAMEQGEIAYAGKYSAPDYETILSADCGLAIENTMIYHTPEVKEQLEKFGVPVLVERSSYESDPLARMEWVKLYGPSAEHMQKIKEYMLKKYKDAQKENGYWLNNLDEYFYTGIDNTKDYEKLVNSITAKEVQDFLAKLLKQNNEIQVVMTMPEENK